MNSVQLIEVNEAIDVCLEKIEQKPRALRNYHRLIRQGERKLAPRIKEWMDETIKEVRAGLSRMRGKTATQKTKSIADWDAIEANGIAILKPTMLELLGEGGKAVVERKIIKQERFDVIGVESVSWANAHTANLVVEITQETMAGIRDVITTGLDAGKSIPTIARELRPIVGLNSRYAGAVANFQSKLLEEGVSASKAAAKASTYAGRLHRRRTEAIARTETAFALTEGQRQGYGQMGATHLERVEDPNTEDDDCADNNGRIYTLAESQGVLPAHPNCEGTWVVSGKVEPPGQYAKELSSRARKYEPGITRSMKGIASDTGATLNKLAFRRKTAGSIERKMAKLAKENPFMSLEQLAKGIQDTVRYTAVAPTKKFASIVNQIDISLGKKGYKLKKVTNYYGKKGPYQGINAKYFDPKSKLTFEVQFHTKQSVAIVEKNHLIYEKARVSTSPEAVTQMKDQMIRNWDNFEVPQGAVKLFSSRI